MPIETQSKIGLISNALVLLGEEPCTSLSDNRYGVTVGANMFETLYESEIQSNSWRFAMKKGALGLLVDVPLNQWKKVFQLPADCLQPKGVFPATPYEIYGNHVYSNQDSLHLDYWFKPEVSAIPAHFALLMTYALARNMSKPVTESDATAVKWEREYVRQRSVSEYADAQGRPAQTQFDSPFTQVR